MTPASTALTWAPQDPVLGRLVIAGCSRRKAATAIPLPALELYQGGWLPLLRARVGHRTELRGRVRILSAEHGIVDADTPLLPYDRRLTPDRARLLRPVVKDRLLAEFATGGVPRAVLVLAEPLYLSLLRDAFGSAPPQPALEWLADPAADWDRAAAVLDGWGWP